MRIVALLLVVSLTGCAHIAGYAGAHPAYIKCKGKGTVTGQGTQSVSVGVGGSGFNGFTLTMDCGDGLEYTQQKDAPAVVPAK